MTDARAITVWLRAHRQGDEGALDQLMALVYEDLVRLARAQRRGAGSTLDTSAIVHEAYMKLARSDSLDVNDRRHFFAVAARVMRQISVDYARGQRRDKRGAGAHHTDFDAQQLGEAPPLDTVLAVDDLLRRLEREAPRMVQVVECRYFVGLSEEETAETLGTSLSTVQREWRRARTKLREALG